ncbi:starch-binding domain-containing protein 1 [Heptranchias perlo]|uniref:starch-binding domain-containing protein 1 n=1 Tax=Heptranchias perlo TaxID=212740 RepID=UPI00355A938D
MAADLLLQGMAAMFSSVWVVLPVALAVALATWVWFNRTASPDLPESQEGAGFQSASPDTDRGRVKSSYKDTVSWPEETESSQKDSADETTDVERDHVPEIKGTELRVGVQQSPAKQKVDPLEAKDISDTMVTHLRDTDFSPALSNKQDLLDSRQMKNFCENDQIPTQLTQLVNVGQATVHNGSITEEKVYVCETITSTISIEKVHEKSDHKDEAFDLVSAVDQNFSGSDYLNNGEMTDTVISDSKADLLNELKSIKTEMERDEAREIFKEQVHAESEGTNVSSEPENIGRKVAAVSPLPLNNISVNFNVHYVTYSNSQIIAVTGNHECLGQWGKYVPLKPNKDGFWSSSIPLPVNSRIEWKYVMVENGKIKRWEECFNRHLETGNEDLEVYQCWGYH